MELRKYQHDAVQAFFLHHLENPGQPTIISVPTGGGKTVIMAQIIKTILGNNPESRGILISHVKELVEQSYRTCMRVAINENLSADQIGIYAAKMNRREIRKLTVASIQSIYKKANDFGRLDYIIIDEAHMVSPNEETMYRKFISAVKVRNSHVYILGLTATPFRTVSGMIYGGADKFFSSCCYHINVNELIEEKYLCPLVTRGIGTLEDLKKIKIRNGDYNQSELNTKMENQVVVTESVNEAIVKATGRKHILVFCTSILHGEMTLQKLKDLGEKSSSLITGKDNTMLRNYKISSFKNGNLRWLINIGVLTTGFDAPHIDCVVLFRPTASKGLFYQMVGRGLRTHESKQDCLILDFGNNAVRLGPIDEYECDKFGNELPTPKTKECKECGFVHSVGLKVCPSCGYKEPEDEEIKKINVSMRVTPGDILSGKRSKKRRYQVINSIYEVYRKDSSNPPCVREIHDTILGDTIISYHSLMKHMEVPLIEWLKKIRMYKYLRENGLKKSDLMEMTTLIKFPTPKYVTAHKNMKGFWVIDEYEFAEGAEKG